MPITKATARAPCPIFAGRGVEFEGFTMAMPRKQYLSCAPENTSSENGLLGIYNYDLADRVYLDDSDVVAFQIYCKVGANIANVTTGRNIHGLDVWVEMDVDDFEVTTNLRNADIRAARIQCQADYGVSGVVTGMYVNSKLRGGSTYLGRYLEYTSSYGAITIEVRSETSGTGTVVAGDGTNYGMAGMVITAKFSNALTGNYHGIALNCPYEGGAVSGSTVGMYFFNTVILTGTAWDVGIDFGSSMVVQCIDVAACTVFADVDVSMSTADNAMEIIVTSTGALSAGYVQALQLTVNHSTGALTGTNELHVLALDTSLTGGSSRGVPYWYGLTIYMSTSANPVTSYMSAISVYLDNQGDACVDVAILDLQQALASALTGGTRSTYIRMRRQGSVTLKCAIRLEGYACTNLVSTDNAGVAPFSTQAGGSLTITHKVAVDMNGTTRYIPIGTIA